MRGYQWGYWEYPGPSWAYPPPPVVLYPQPFNSFLQGSCASYETLDLRLLDDEELRQNVIASIWDDPRISRRDKENIRVRAENGIVFLSGIVRQRGSKFQAYWDAFQTPGAVDVKSTIEVVSLKSNRL